MEEKKVDERRRHPRVQSRLPVQYKDLKKLNKLASGSLSLDLGQGGVRFRSNEFISLACRLVLEINLPSNPRPIKAISKVAWIRKSPSGDEYEIGNQFLEMTKEDKQHIADFVNKLISASL